MQLTSFEFLLFAAVLVLLYYTLFRRNQWPLLLAASFVFYLRAGVRYLVFILFTILTTYIATRRMDDNSAALAALPREERKAQKAAVKRENRLWMALCLGVNFGLLAVCKIRFTLENLALPFGISFYMFQTMGYVVDVYRGKVRAERNVFKLALFVSYFPQLVQGPISRYDRLAEQLYEAHPYDGKQLSFGLQRMLWGCFKKLVIADRIAPAVAALKGPEYTGVSFLVLTVFYAVQIYGDFTGGIDMALGVSQMLGIRLTENFDRPFSSKSVAEYWRRWHISLGAWMKDYIFYPVSVSTPLRKLSRSARARFGDFGKRLPVYAASLVTWFVTGIWHGLTPNFILWGMLNCLAIVASEELTPLYEKFHSRFHLKEKPWYGGFACLRTVTLMNLIRACDLFPNVGDYFRKVGSLFAVSNFHILWDGTLLGLGLSGLDYGVLAGGVGLMLTVSLVRARRGSIRESLWKGNTWVRYGLTFGLFLAVLLMGCYGVGYDASNFIYNQF